MNNGHIIETIEELESGMEVILEDITNTARDAGTFIPMEDAVFDLCEKVQDLRDYWLTIKTFGVVLEDQK